MNEQAENKKVSANESPIDLTITPEKFRGLASIDRDGTAFIGSLDLKKTEYLQQNWSERERRSFYRLPQGSQILPLKFALALEKKDSDRLFLSNENLSSYGFILQKQDARTNPFGLPVGFTVDGDMRFRLAGAVEDGERSLGINCGLCHTTDFQFQGKAFRVDGGQTLVRFQDFINDLDQALKATREDEAKLNSFLERVLKIDRSGHSKDRATLLAQLDSALSVRGDWSNINDSGHTYGHAYNSTNFAYGPGRIDAFSGIFNEVLARDLGVPGNSREPNAPVNPPVLWDTPHHDWVEWNGLTSNDPNIAGPFARNAAQVLGVFGHIDFSKQTTLLKGYCLEAPVSKGTGSTGSPVSGGQSVPV